MAYQIQYDSKTQKFEIQPQPSHPFFWLTGICFLLFIFYTACFWPEGYAVIQDVLIPGDNEVTAQAFQSMMNALRAGVPFSDAVTTFCRNILYGV